MDDYREVLPEDWQGRYQEFLAQPELRQAIATGDSDLFFKTYPRVVNGPPPFVTPPPVPSDSRVGLVSTAGIYLPGQAPFRWQGLFGDTSVRTLPLRPLDGYSIAHGHYDEGPVRQDQNVLWPAALLAELVRLGEIGSIAATGYAIDGYCTDAIGLVREAGEAIYAGMRDEGVDIALIVPV